LMPGFGDHENYWGTKKPSRGIRSSAAISPSAHTHLTALVSPGVLRLVSIMGWNPRLPRSIQVIHTSRVSRPLGWRNPIHRFEQSLIYVILFTACYHFGETPTRHGASEVHPRGIGNPRSASSAAFLH
jgi:hypothetical protein